MAGLIGWLLSTVCPRVLQRQNRYNIPLPSQCHMSLTAEQLDGRPVFVVGDVHGCFEELCELLQIAGSRQSNPFVVFVGDMINKGPLSIQVLRLVKQMTEKGQAAAVRGNHEESVLRELWAMNDRGDNYDLPVRYKWLLELSDDEFAFLQSLPYTISIPSLQALVVHAGLIPGLPLELQNLDSVTHMRNIIKDDFLSGHGLKGISKAEHGDPWASLWPGPEHVYFGHDARRGLQQWPTATGLDTGCLYGRCLTGVFIGKEPEFLSVNAKKMYVVP